MRFSFLHSVQVSSGGKDRRISLADFQTGLSKLLSLPARQSRVVFDAFDADGSGFLDFGEVGFLVFHRRRILDVMAFKRGC